VTHENSYGDPFERPVEYSPTDKKVMDLELAKARRLLRPHLLLIQVLSSQFQAVKYREPGIMMSLVRLMMRSLAAAKHMRWVRSLARRVSY
jgi:phosphatidylinositol 4-kinase